MTEIVALPHGKTRVSYRANAAKAPSLRVDRGGDPLLSLKAAVDLRSGAIDFPSLPMIDLSIVTYRSHEDLPGFFDSLLAQRYPLEKIGLYITRHSDDTEDERLIEDFVDRHGRRFGSVTVVSQANCGFGGGHNRNLAESSARYFVVSNVDLTFFDDTLVNLIRFLELAEPQCVAVEARQFPFEHPKFYNPVTFETSWISCCLAAFDRMALERVGAFDSYLFMYGEDVELSLRLRSHGYRLAYCPFAPVGHDFARERDSQLNFAGGFEAGILADLSANPVALLRLLHPRRARSLLAYMRLRGVKPGCRRIAGLLRRGWRRHAIRRLRRLDNVALPKNGADFEWRRPFSVSIADLEARKATGRRTKPAVTVSILMRAIPTHIEAIHFALQSALLQTYGSVEVILLEDGSATLFEAKSLNRYLRAGLQFRYIAVEKVGRARACNLLMAAARGTHLVFLDDDDFLFLDHVETLVDEGLAGGADLAAAWAASITARKDPVGIKDSRFALPQWYDKDFAWQGMLEFNYFPIQSLLFSHRDALSVGRINENLNFLEDWNFFARLISGKSLRVVKRVTSCFRVPKGWLSNRRRAKEHRADYGTARTEILAFAKRVSRPQANARLTLRLLYHRIGRPDADPYGIHVSPDRFADHLDVIVNRMDKGIVARHGGPKSDLPRIEIHFDDAYADAAEAARRARARGLEVKIFATGYSFDGTCAFPTDRFTTCLRADRGLAIGAARAAVAGNGVDRLPPDDAPMEGWIRYFAELWKDAPNKAEKVLARVEAAIEVPFPAGERVLSSTQLAELVTEGCVVGAHSLTHTRLSGRPPEYVAGELTAIAERLGPVVGPGRIVDFAVPYGGEGDIDSGVVKAATDAGFTALYSCLGRDVEIGENTVLGRFQVANTQALCFADALDSCLARYMVDGNLDAVPPSHFCHETFAVLHDTRW